MNRSSGPTSAKCVVLRRDSSPINVGVGTSLYTQMIEKRLKVFAVNLLEGQDKIKPFREQNNYTFTVPLDRDGSVAKSYKVQGIPTQVLIGRDGMIKKVFIGFGGEAQMKEMDQAIETALRAKTPTARGPATRPAQG